MPLVSCGNCGLLFASRAIEVVSSNLSIGGGTEPCPRCNSQAAIISGQYVYNANGVMTSFDPRSLDLYSVHKILGIISEAKTLGDTPQNLIKKIEKVNSPLAEFLSRGEWAGIGVIAAILLGILSLLFVSNQTTNNITINNYQTPEKSIHSDTVSKKNPNNTNYTKPKRKRKKKK